MNDEGEINDLNALIELRRLRYLVTLAMRLSYSRAAEELGISQSALTRAIQSLWRRPE